MAAPPAPSQPSLSNDYDIDDDPADESPAEPLPSAPAVTPAPGPSSPAQERERNSDGTYKKAAHPRYLARQARDLGFSDEELDELSTDQLGEAVYAANRQANQQALFNLQQRAKENHPGGQPRDGSVTDRREEPQGESLFKMDPETEALYEPKFIQPLKTAFDSMQKELRELREQVTGVVRADQAREAQTGAQRLDACFQGDPEQFGKGTGAKVKKMQPALFQRRLAVIAVMKSLDSGSVEDRFAEAVEILYAQQPAAQPSPAAAPEPAGRTPAQQWADAALARPTHRKGAKEPPGVKKAIESVTALQREINGALDGPDTTVDDFPE